MPREPESRSAVAVGFEWASRVSTIAIGFSLPAIIGFGVDRWLGSSPVATLVGVVVGFGSGLTQILRLANNLPGQQERRTPRSRTGSAEQPLNQTDGGSDLPSKPPKAN